MKFKDLQTGRTYTLLQYRLIKDEERVWAIGMNGWRVIGIDAEWAGKDKNCDHDRRLLFNVYLQGKRDQIYWPTKWEELAPIGKRRVIKQFLAWYSTNKRLT